MSEAHFKTRHFGIANCMRFRSFVVSRPRIRRSLAVLDDRCETVPNLHGAPSSWLRLTGGMGCRPSWVLSCLLLFRLATQHQSRLCKIPFLKKRTAHTKEMTQDRWARGTVRKYFCGVIDGPGIFAPAPVPPCILISYWHYRDALQQIDDFSLPFVPIPLI